ncbi:hypothetical protein CYJ10_16580 [Cupriavidus pauculus]|uniref:Uncharacterized protein n=1 Tax=Cupriavidus pauculus TaxID=82633 RepID=A0A2N5CB38_9BURK|nr:hypothetical protein CYJ10_16580 [Cupriavidus pauculus]
MRQRLQCCVASRGLSLAMLRRIHAIHAVFLIGHLENDGGCSRQATGFKRLKNLSLQIHHHVNDASAEVQSGLFRRFSREVIILFAIAATVIHLR